MSEPFEIALPPGRVRAYLRSAPHLAPVVEAVEGGAGLTVLIGAPDGGGMVVHVVREGVGQVTVATDDGDDGGPGGFNGMDLLGPLRRADVILLTVDHAPGSAYSQAATAARVGHRAVVIETTADRSATWARLCAVVGHHPADAAAH